VPAKHILNNIVLNIQQEYNANIDKFSQDLIIAQLELLLKYADRRSCQPPIFNAQN
jgi:hypothetical protein